MKNRVFLICRLITLSHTPYLLIRKALMLKSIKACEFLLFLFVRWLIFVFCFSFKVTSKFFVLIGVIVIAVVVIEIDIAAVVFFIFCLVVVLSHGYSPPSD